MEYLYITNDPKIAKICEENDVIPWIDLETLGKEERQKGMDTVKSKHSIEDIVKIKKVISKVPILVRINPLNSESKTEIDRVITAGADIIMLPMFKNAVDVKKFVELVDNRVKIMLLLETKEAVEDIDNILKIPEVNMIHIGLNDLHLSYGLNFMFELLENGIVDKLCSKFQEYNIQYGIGGIAKLGFGKIPSEFIINQYYILGCSRVILSRSFCNYKKYSNYTEFEKSFKDELTKIKYFTKAIKSCSELYRDNTSKKLKKVLKRCNYNE